MGERKESEHMFFKSNLNSERICCHSVEIQHWQASYTFHRPLISVRKFTEHPYRPLNVAQILFCSLCMMDRLYIKIVITTVDSSYLKASADLVK